ncbi:hypothetical protein [Aeromicrobium sp.]
MTLGPLFDRVGRIPMISGTDILSGVLLCIAGLVLDDVDAVALTVIGAVLFAPALAAPRRARVD